MIGEITAEEREHLERIRGLVDFAYDGLHRHFRARWDHFDGLYNNYDDMARSLSDASPRDRDSVVGDARSEFGHELFIPHTFATVELIVARTLATPPKMLFLPKRAEAVGVTDRLRELFACQQADVDYELVLQDIGKNGQINNLGVQKCGWRKTVRDSSQLEKGPDGQWIVANPQEETVFDGPTAESVSPYDWIWDPFGTSLSTLRWAVHRTWRSDRYVLQRLGLLDGQDPTTATWKAMLGRLEVADVEGENANARFSESKTGRDRARGLRAGGSQSAASSDATKAGRIHEVWEYHDAETDRVVIVLDRKWVVAEGSNPNWKGGLPFQIYRPTALLESIPGKGAIEPAEDLQHETNMLRTNRQWNALLKLHQAYAYNDGAVDPDDIKIGPGKLVAVNGDPNGLLVPLTVGDIPQSSYQEEAAYLQDIFRTAGIQDPNEQAAAPETATGVQLVQQATQARTWLTTRRAALEIVRPGARYWLQLNKQRILEPVPVRVPQTPTVAGGLPYNFAYLGPEDLQNADHDIEVEGGLEAQNVAQDRSDAQSLLGLSQDQRLQGEALLVQALEKLGLANPEQYLAPQQQMVSADVVAHAMAGLRIPDPEIQKVIAAALLVQQNQQQGGGQ